MKFLLVSLFHEGSLSWYCARALKKLGNDVNIFYPWKSAGIRFHLKDKIGINYNKEEAYFSIGKALIQKVKQYKPEVIFVIKGLEILPEILVKIKKDINCVLINWWPDDPHLNEASRKISVFYDLFFTHDQGSIPVYKKYGAKNTFCLNFACDPEIHKDLQNGVRKYSYDLSFIGGWNAKREKCLEPFVKFNFSIWGPHWERIKKGSPLKGAIKGGQVLGYEMTEIYNRSKIVLNMHATLGGLRSGVNMRTFEIPACQSFELVDKNKYLNELFVNNEELVCYGSLEEAFKHIEYYLTHEDERMNIARKGQQRAYTSHTYKQRMEMLISIIKNVVEIT